MKPTLLAHRYRAYPTPAQESVLLQISGCCRFVFNKALERHTSDYAAKGKSPSKQDMVKLIKLWKEDHSFLRQALSQPLQQAVYDLYDGFERFFKGQNAYPTWRKFSDAPSFRLPQPDQFKILNIKGSRKKERMFSFPKMGQSGTLGPLRFVLHKELTGQVRSATISREGGMWYISFCVARRDKRMSASKALSESQIEDAIERAKTTGDISDLSINAYDRNVARNGAVVSQTGQRWGRVITTAGLEAKEAFLRQEVARKEEVLRRLNNRAPGSSLRGLKIPQRLTKARQRLAKFLGKLARIRKDVAHKISRELVDTSDVVIFEALDTASMTSSESDKDVQPWESKRDKKTRKDILDVGWYMIEQQVAYKAAWEGKMIVRVNPAYTSQACSCCGHIDEKNRDDRTFKCRACGFEDNADVNAAKNIRRLGIAVMLGQVAPSASVKDLKRIEPSEGRGLRLDCESEKSESDPLGAGGAPKAHPNTAQEGSSGL